MRSELLPTKRGGWWERLTIDLVHLKRHADALAACLQALSDPWLVRGALAEAASIRKRGLRLHRKLQPQCKEHCRPKQLMLRPRAAVERTIRGRPTNCKKVHTVYSGPCCAFLT